MTSVQIIALIVVILSAIKLVFLFTKPKSWFDIVGSIWLKKGVATVISLILGFIVLSYLLTELTIVQVYASFALMGLIFWILIAPYRKELFDAVMPKLTAKEVMQKNWLGLLIWTLLSVWVLVSIF